MTNDNVRAARRRAALAALAVGMLLVAAPLSVGGQAAPAGLDHAVGSLIWRSWYEHTGEDPGDTWTTGQEAIITVRLVRDTSIHITSDPAEVYWIDDGSSFRAQIAWEWATPYQDGECTVYRGDTYWANVARVDAIDPATGHQPSSISMTQDDGGRLTWVNAALSGGPTASWNTAHGGEDDWCGRNNGLTIEPWDSLSSDAAMPWCPLDIGGAAAIGKPDATGTRIDYSCVDDKSGVDPPGGGRWRQLVRVEGSVRLVP